MHRLVRVVGPAPSERTTESFLTVLTKERDRVRREITLFRSRGTTTKSRKPRAQSKRARNAAYQAMADEYGITLDQMLEILKAQKGEQ